MLSKLQTNLYNDLFALTSNEAFYFQDFTLENSVYRIFNYRLATYSDFMLPNALEVRGIMFELDTEGNPMRLASRPMQKFFNLNENPSTMNLDLALVDTVELKADGSLMSSYTHGGSICLKSRGSLFSEQALDAMKWMHGHPSFMEALRQIELSGYTTNLEWCAPHNRIVIGYPMPHLKVLNVRNRETGEYLVRNEVERIFGVENVIDRVNLHGMDVPSFIKQIPAMQDDIEGYVGRIKDLWFKVKTDKYMSLHHAKDSINNPRRLFEAVVDEGVDDLRAMFAHDALAIQQIDEMQHKVTHLYNHMVSVVENFYVDNRHLERKEFAIKAQNKDVVPSLYFGLVMSKYAGKLTDYKAFIKSKYKELGFKDEKVEIVKEQV